MIYVHLTTGSFKMYHQLNGTFDDDFIINLADLDPTTKLHSLPILLFYLKSL